MYIMSYAVPELCIPLQSQLLGRVVSLKLCIYIGHTRSREVKDFSTLGIIEVEEVPAENNVW